MVKRQLNGSQDYWNYEVTDQFPEAGSKFKYRPDPITKKGSVDTAELTVEKIE